MKGRTRRHLQAYRVPLLLWGCFLGGVALSAWTGPPGQLGGTIAAVPALAILGVVVQAVRKR